MLTVACDNIDRLVCVEMRRKGLPVGFKTVLYDKARARSHRPLVQAAAELLNVAPARIGIVTGAAVPDHMPVGENDGPFGATVLGEVLTRIGHDVSIYTDAVCAPPIKRLVERRELAVPVVSLRFNDRGEQERIAEEQDILVAIERLGGNANGSLHGINANCRDAFRCNVDHLFRMHAGLGRASLAIGDGGNEIGFGKTSEDLVAAVPELAQVEKTGSVSGIFSTVETSVLVVANTSNLGAYGVVAALAILRDDLSLCHMPTEETALHHVGVGLGLTDGATGRRIPVCDGVPAEANAAIVLLLRNIVDRALAPPLVREF